jgi:hypothetical protein
MKNGVVSAPVQLVRHGDRYKVKNGAHRYWASQKCGYSLVPALIADPQ